MLRLDLASRSPKRPGWPVPAVARATPPTTPTTGGGHLRGSEAPTSVRRLRPAVGGRPGRPPVSRGSNTSDPCGCPRGCPRPQNSPASSEFDSRGIPAGKGRPIGRRRGTPGRPLRDAGRGRRRAVWPRARTTGENGATTRRARGAPPPIGGCATEPAGTAAVGCASDGRVPKRRAQRLRFDSRWILSACGRVCLVGCVAVFCLLPSTPVARFHRAMGSLDGASGSAPLFRMCIKTNERT